MIITGVALLLGGAGYFVGSDINPSALKMTSRTLERNGVR